MATTINLRGLFARQGIANEVISLRNCLTNHPSGLTIGLKEAQRLLRPASSDGFAHGCRVPNSIKISVAVADQSVAEVAPSWVPVVDEKPRTVEGVLAESKIAVSDFPFKPWHVSHDWNFLLRVDTQYTYLASDANFTEQHNGIFECEWETAFLPSWAWPMKGSRLWAVGRWIYDCGHPEGGHVTEIHPVKAVASFRRDGFKLPGNKGVTRTTRAPLFISRNGGYLRQPINDQDYAFDLYLPPRPSPAAKPQFLVESQTGTLPVKPQITPFPNAAPQALRVVIPLKDVTPHPEEYGVIIHGGWSDPTGVEATRMRHVRITIEQIDIHKDMDSGNLGFGGAGEWHVFVGVNGRWHVKAMEIKSDKSQKLNFVVTLALHPDDPIEIAVCGFEADALERVMGVDTGVSVVHMSARNTLEDAKKVAERIRNAWLGHLASHAETDPFKDNDAIGLLFVTHRSDERKSFSAKQKPEGNYTLRYRIEDND